MKIAAIGFGILSVLLILAYGGWVMVVNNVERPGYSVVEQDGAFEIRDYTPQIVAEVTLTGPRSETLSRGFQPLADYIFAKRRGRSAGGEQIAMTAPVTQTPSGANPSGANPSGAHEDEKIAMTAPVTQSAGGDGAWTVRFIMPSEYTMDTLPEPAKGVTLEEIPPRRMAAVRFSGWANDASLAAQEAKLRAWIDARDLEPMGAPTYAFYNDPFTIGPLRRNEVLLPLGPAGAGS